MNHLQASNAPKLLTPHSRFFLCYCVSLLVLGPFGFVVGPSLAWFFRRRAERLHPIAAAQAKARDTGFHWAQWWGLTLVTLWGLGGLITVVPMLLMTAYTVTMGQSVG